MYEIQKTHYGFKLIFADYIEYDEMKQWADEFEKNVKMRPGKFGVFVDMRNLKPMPANAQGEVKRGQKIARMEGMERSVVILDNTVTTMQFKRLARDTGIYEWERYINSSSEPNWEKVGLDWIIRGVDPDKK